MLSQFISALAWAPRSDGDGQFAIYPMWTVIIDHDKPGKYNVNNYDVLIWADNGAIVTYGSEAYYTTTPPNSDNSLTAGLVLLLTASVLALAVGMGPYLHRKRRKYHVKVFAGSQPPFS